MWNRALLLASLSIVACTDDRGAAAPPPAPTYDEDVGLDRWVGELAAEGGPMTLHQAFGVEVPATEDLPPLGLGWDRALEPAVIVAIGTDTAAIVGWEEIRRPPAELSLALTRSFGELARALSPRGDAVLVIDRRVPWATVAGFLETLRLHGITTVTFVAEKPSKVPLPPSGSSAVSPIWKPRWSRPAAGEGWSWDLPPLDDVGVDATGPLVDVYAGCPVARGVLAAVPHLDLEGRLIALREALPAALRRCPRRFEGVAVRQHYVGWLRGRDPTRVDAALTLALDAPVLAQRSDLTFGDAFPALAAASPR